MSYQLTQEQTDAVNLAMTGASMKLSAFAGAGKTSTLVAIANALRQQNKRGLYLAFNKAIATEAMNKMPPNVMSSTFHSLALSQLPHWVKLKLNQPVLFPRPFADRYHLRPMQLAFEKENFRTKKVRVTKSSFTINSQKYFIDKALTHFMKTASNAPQARHMEYVLTNQSDIAPESIAYAVEQLTPVMQKVWADYIDPNVQIRITHDCYLKMWAMTNPILNVDFILFDEAQDADPIMYQILVNQPCQVIYVGDQYQQIYSWRGAVNMMQQLDNLKLAKQYITKSFRFSPDLANYANPILKYMGATQDIKGLESLTTEIDLNQYLPTDVDAVLCRTNMQAIEVLFAYAKMGKVGVVKNINLDDTVSLLKKLDEFKNDSSVGQSHNMLRYFSDFDDLLAYQNEYPSDRDIIPTLNIYQNYGLQMSLDIIQRCIKAEINEEYDFIVTTAHQAKGLEFDNVLLTEDFLTPFELQGQLSEDSVSQTNPEELRLLYVAVTRAKKKLYAINVSELISIIGGMPPRKN